MHNLYKIKFENKGIANKANVYYLNKQIGQDKEHRERGDIKNKISEFIELKRTESPQNKVNAVKDKKSLKEKILKPPILETIHPLIKLEDKEEKVFSFIKDYILKDKYIVFSHDKTINDEIVVLYVKDNELCKDKELAYNYENSDDPLNFLSKKIPTNRDINTIDELSVRYSVVKNLTFKHYIVLKEVMNVNEDKKVYLLLLSKSFLNIYKT